MDNLLPDCCLVIVAFLEPLELFFLKQVNKKYFSLLVTQTASPLFLVESYFYLDTASSHGYLSIVRWLREQGFPDDHGHHYWAAMNGHLPILQYVHSQGSPITKDSIYAAIQGGHLPILLWFKDIGIIDGYCHQKGDLCSLAAKSGYPEILQWLREQYRSTGQTIYDWDEETFTETAKTGNLSLLQWLKQEQCPWNAMTTVFTARKGHLAVLRWLVENGCPYDRINIKTAAQHKNFPSIIEWVDKYLF